MSFSIKIIRQTSSLEQTTGTLVVLNSKGQSILTLSTLELPWLMNQTRMSCIPCGNYVVAPHISWSKGKCLAFANVPSRMNILVHSGNYNHDTLGCVLVGCGFADINHDGFLDLVHSRKAMKSLLELITESTAVEVLNEWESLEVKK